MTIPNSASSANSANSTSTTETMRGVWQRQFEEDPLGDAANADRDTLVVWTQAPKSGIYVDLRLPKGSFGRMDRATTTNASNNANSIPKLPSALQARGMMVSWMDASLLSNNTDWSILLRQKSFAGRLHFSLGDNTTVSGQALAKDRILANLAKEAAAAAADTLSNHGNNALPLCTCFWKRDIDYQPPSGGLDIGVCASTPPNADGSIDLRETGDDGSYAEGWHRLVGSETGPFFAGQLLTENGIVRTGYWVRTGKYFAYAIGRPHDKAAAETLGCSPRSSQIQTCVGKSLHDAVQELIVDCNNQNDDDDDDKTVVGKESLLMVGAYVCVFGEIITLSSDMAEGEGTARTVWKIMHSTDPCLVGCDLLGPGPDSCTSRLSREASTNNNPDFPSLQEGDILGQTVVGLGECIRRWQVIEVDNAAAMIKDMPGLSQQH